MSKERTIEIVIYFQTVTINLTGDGGGNINFPFKEKCEFCGNEDCLNDCFDIQEYISNRDLECQQNQEKELRSRLEFNNMIDGISSLVLAQAIAGIDIESNTYIEALNTTISSCGNNV